MWTYFKPKDLDVDRVHQSLHSLSHKYGPIVSLRLLKKKIVVLNSADVINKAFASEENKALLNDKTKGFYGTYLVYGHADVLLGPYSALTFRIKDVMYQGLRPSMAPAEIRAECLGLVQSLAESGGRDFDPSIIVEKLLAEVTSKVICGHVREGDADVMWDFVDWSNKLLNPSMEGWLKNFPYLRHFPCKSGRLFQTVKTKRDQLMKRYLDDARESYKSGLIRGMVDTCFHIQSSEKGPDGNSWLSDDMIRATILDTIGAGLVSTRNSIMATLLNLLHNKECTERMREEISRELKSHITSGGDDMKKMPYSHAVILETLRLSCVVPIVSHYCSTKDVQFNGYTIEKGTMVWGNIWSCHHDDTWGDPWSFRPKRFLTEEGTVLPKSHKLMKAFMPLGVGCRYCVGSDIAIQRIFAYITTIVQQFDIYPPKDSELLSNDPNLFTAGAVLQLDRFNCRMIRR
ncbi:cytochrome P450 1A1-like isoform X2 [Mya arenaria]|uniref:cytochrome P450 1A1-like isoform X2 n=1 Tax=Mya arenaria TaxID=6604 RepID=UPI0022E991C8|nr:cytochrome P450 1A1-like isoform X2 [Mya arenaria]